MADLESTKHCEETKDFPVYVKRNCVLASTLFALYISMLVRYCVTAVTEGTRFLTDGKPFNLSRLKAQKKVYLEMMTAVMFAGDLCFRANCPHSLQ